MGGSWIGFTALAVAIVALCLTLSHSANEKRGFDPQCYKPYETLTDAWRATSHGGTGPSGKNMGDVELGDVECQSGYEQATGVGGNKWYRFAGVGGGALPLTAPGAEHCGTDAGGWLSDWDAHPCTKDAECTSDWCESGVCTPRPEHPAPPGHYPEATEGVVEMTACFDFGIDDAGRAWTCGAPSQVGVVMCDGFLLWRLPYAPDCLSAYCTAASGL